MKRTDNNKVTLEGFLENYCMSEDKQAGQPIALMNIVTISRNRNKKTDEIENIKVHHRVKLFADDMKETERKLTKLTEEAHDKTNDTYPLVCVEGFVLSQDGRTCIVAKNCDIKHRKASNTINSIKLSGKIQNAAFTNMYARIALLPNGLDEPIRVIVNKNTDPEAYSKISKAGDVKGCPMSVAGEILTKTYTDGTTNRVEIAVISRKANIQMTRKISNGPSLD